MYAISPAQIKAARSLLDWTRDDLALASCVSIKTVAKLETGQKISLARLIEIRSSLEKKGVEFVGNKGVVLNDNEAHKYSGPEGVEQFYNDMLSSAKEYGGEIHAVYNTAEQLAASLGIANHSNLDRLTQLSKYAEIKCLLTDANNSSLMSPDIQFKALTTSPVGIWSTFLCGNKLAFVFMTGRNEFWYYVITASDITIKERMHFADLWDNALPFAVESKKKA